MMSEDEALRRAFASGSERRAPEGGCPEPDVLWAAAAGELPAAERRAVIDHSSRCPACAEDFRIVAGMVREAPPSAASAPARGVVVAGPWITRPANRWLLGSIAATLMVTTLLAGYIGRFLGGDLPEVYRGGEDEIVSLLGEDAVLERSDAVLRWRGPQGARFAVFVTTADLRLVAQAGDLAADHYRLAPEVLAAFPAGAALDWRVEAALADGRKLASPLFRFRLAE